MYKWLASIAIGSSSLYMLKKTANNSSDFDSQNSDMTHSLSVSNGISFYDYDWLSGVIDVDDVTYVNNAPQTSIFDTTLTNTNENYSMSLINTYDYNITDDKNSILSNYGTYSPNSNNDNLMMLSSGNSFSTFIRSQPITDKETNITVKDRSKSGNQGITSLQKRIERVKNDIITLSNKLNTKYPVEKSVENINDNGALAFYNLGFGNMIENDDCIISDEENNSVNLSKVSEISAEDKTWKCPSDFQSKTSETSNPYSDLSEHTQKILNRLKNKSQNATEDSEFSVDNDLEMEDDEIQFSVPVNNPPPSLIHSFISRNSTLPPIEEQDETNLSISSDDDDEEEEEEDVDPNKVAVDSTIDLFTESNSESTLIERLKMTDMDSLNTPSSTDTATTIEMSPSDTYESFVTAVSHLTNPQRENKHKLIAEYETEDNTEEYFSDTAVGGNSSISSNDTLMVLTLQNPEDESEYFNGDNLNSTLKQEFEIGDSNTPTLQNKFIGSEMTYNNVNENENEDMGYHDEDEAFDDNDEAFSPPRSFYDNSSMRMSSLPDLLDDNPSSALNRSTDLDAVLNNNASLLMQAPKGAKFNVDSVGKGRLSVSTGNLAWPNDTQHDSGIHSNCNSNSNYNYTGSVLLETDIDSGFVSLYQPRITGMSSSCFIRETEIQPRITFGPDGCSSSSNYLENSGTSGGSVKINRLAERLKHRAQSIPELRIANSINKLNVPDWLELSISIYDDDNIDGNNKNNNNNDGEFLHSSLPIGKYASSSGGGGKASNLTLSSYHTTNHSTTPTRSLSKPYQSLIMTNNKKSENYSSNSNSNSSSSPSKVSCSPVVLPSASLRQKSTAKLKPIKVCQARTLLPNKVTVSSLKQRV